MLAVTFSHKFAYKIVDFALNGRAIGKRVLHGDLTLGRNSLHEARKFSS